MIEPLTERLERKRAELKLTKGAFAWQLKLGRTKQGAETYYAQILRGLRPFPRKRYPLTAEILGCEVEELKSLPPTPLDTGRRMGRMNQIKLSCEDLTYLAGITKAAGGPLPLSLLLQHLPNKPSPSS